MLLQNKSLNKSLAESRSIFQKHHNFEGLADDFCDKTLDLLGIEKELEGVAVIDSSKVIQ